MRKVMVTGSAGFVGFHLCRRLLAEGVAVCGLDGMTPYYDVALKRARSDHLCADARFRPVEALLQTPGAVSGAVSAFGPDVIVHLAAQAGVRYSIEAPRSYVDSNLVGTFEVLEAARAQAPAHLLIASTSSAYGANTSMPYAETDRADHQLSFYAATKKATESMAHSYAHLYRIPTTMFRFFTVYGPWGRPDMAYFLFIRAMLEGRPIEVFNHGDMKRDFTYVDDLVEGILRLIDAVPGDVPVENDSLSPAAPFRVVNLGNGAPVALMDFIAAIEDALGVTAEKVFKPMQPGDVPATWADTRLADALIGKLPRTDLRKGVGEFVRWYRERYGV